MRKDVNAEARYATGSKGSIDMEKRGHGRCICMSVGRGTAIEGASLRTGLTAGYRRV